jgi:hypothetical protein
MTLNGLKPAARCDAGFGNERFGTSSKSLEPNWPRLLVRLALRWPALKQEPGPARAAARHGLPKLALTLLFRNWHQVLRRFQPQREQVLRLEYLLSRHRTVPLSQRELPLLQVLPQR